MKCLFNLFFLLLTVSSFSQIEKIEPPFWWTGMNVDSLQILVYGKDISNYEVKFSNDVIIKEVSKTENPNYLFITINTKEIQPGNYTLNFYKAKKKAFSSNYEFKARDENSASRKGFDASDVMYLIMPDRFANGNSENDNTKNTAEKANRNNPGGRHGGDIKGVLNHLDYLEELGVTTLWSTPLLEDNEPVYSYHGYAQSDYYKIDPRYGTNADYYQLATELHKRNMKLVMDYVTNHWGSKHWIIQDLPSKDWIHYWENGENGFQRSNYRMTTQFDENASEFDAKACMDGWFDTTMPDVNQRNPLVLNYMIQNAIWWIEYAKLDGLRVDTYSYNDKGGIAKWTDAIMKEYPNFNIVGEVWMQSQAQMAYWQKDSKIGAIENYNSQLPSVMDFTLYNAITGMFNEDHATYNTGVIRAYENFANDFLYPDINNILVFGDNHDTNRMNEVFKGDLNKYKLALTLLATVRGIPQLYYGDEIGMMGNKDTGGDGDIRRDFPGGWQGDPNDAFTDLGRTTTQKDYFDFSKKLLNWRKNKTVIHSGKTMQFIPQDNVYVYFRYNDRDKVMVIINNNPDSQTLELNRYEEILKQSKSGFEIISGKQMMLENTLNIEGKSSMIIELK